MRCSGCGKDIPFTGSVCPYCQRDKSKDQTGQALAFVFGPIGAAAGGWMFGFWGGVGGLVAGFIAAILMSGMSKTEPPKVTVVSTAPPDSAPTPSSTITTPAVLTPPSSAARLTKLKDLLDQGFIDGAEYGERRKAILDEI